jgi:hypothetical protein
MRIMGWTKSRRSPIELPDWPLLVAGALLVEAAGTALYYWLYLKDFSLGGFGLNIAPALRSALGSYVVLFAIVFASLDHLLRRPWSERARRWSDVVVVVSACFAVAALFFGAWALKDGSARRSEGFSPSSGADFSGNNAGVTSEESYESQTVRAARIIQLGTEMAPTGAILALSVFQIRRRMPVRESEETDDVTPALDP